MPKVTQTPYQLHVAKWTDCDRCELCAKRSKVVFARGKLPCDVLFIGEAPGDSEDVLGRPFVGPAGQLLDELIEAAKPNGLTIAFTNLVGCIPRDEEGKGEPSREAIMACRDKLLELIQIAQPTATVCVGKLAAKYAVATEKTVEIVHPAAILRADIAKRGLMYQRAQVILSDLFEELTVPF